jgi:hypothetical protein
MSFSISIPFGDMRTAVERWAQSPRTKEEVLQVVGQASQVARTLSVAAPFLPPPLAAAVTAAAAVGNQHTAQVAAGVYNADQSARVLGEVMDQLGQLPHDLLASVPAFRQLAASLHEASRTVDVTRRVLPWAIAGVGVLLLIVTLARRPREER